MKKEDNRHMGPGYVKIQGALLQSVLTGITGVGVQAPRFQDEQQRRARQH